MSNTTYANGGPIHPPQPAAMGIPLDELIERAAKRAQYLAVVEMEKVISATLDVVQQNLSESMHPALRPARGDIPFAAADIMSMIGQVAQNLNVPLPKNLR